MKKLLSTVLSVVMVGTMFTACGGNNAAPTPAPSTSTPPASSATSETPSEPKVEPITMNVAYMPNYGSLWSVTTAIKKGYFEEEGITVNMVEFADGPTIIAAMESGSIDVGYIGQGAHKLCINCLLYTSPKGETMHVHRCNGATKKVQVLQQVHHGLASMQIIRTSM